MKTQATSVRTQCKNPHGFPSFPQKAITVGARALWSRWRRHVRRKTNPHKSSKNKNFEVERNAQSQVRTGFQRNRHRPPPAPRRPQSKRLRVEPLWVAVRSLVSICPVSCFTLFFLCALLFGVQLVLDICVCLCWSAVFVCLIFMCN